MDYLAPASLPSTNPVSLTATSAADPTKFANAPVTVVPAGPVSVNISPPFAVPGPAGRINDTVQFFANVSGTSNQHVTWSVASGVSGQGCTGSACGTISSSGLYTAPSIAPSPNSIAVIATSQADATKSAHANVSLTDGPVIEALFPSSVMAGVPSTVTFALEGQSFVAGSGSSASTILINGTARTTTCASSTQCVTVLNLSDLATPGAISVQLQNPGSPGPLSNPVLFIVVPFVVAEDVIPLSATQSTASGKDIIVFEPTTGLQSSQINVDFAGPLTGSGSSATCTIAASPITIVRPVSGPSVSSICVHGNLLDPSFAYAFTGPAVGDISITASAITGLFPNTIELDLTITNSTLPGVRTLFITTLNNDKAAAGGLIEVK
ncbi:MAG: hypothetical protein ACRD50_12460 [Candidatus Acidiferrales bacterium]